MKIIRSPAPLDETLFHKATNELPARFGLPSNVKYCTSCVISNQRPNSTVEFANKKNANKETINFDDNGICDACNFATKKRSNIAWESREQQLWELCDKHRSKDGSYDCIVPGSGGKDSFYTSHILKYKYGMNPLTVTWAPNIYTEWGWQNFQSWIHAGHDNILMTPNGKVHRVLTRLSTELLFHPFQAFMLGQKTIAPRIALQFGIPLVFYGENEAEYGNPLADTNSAVRDKSFFAADSNSEVRIGGVTTEDLKSHFGMTDGDLHLYTPVSEEKVDALGMEVHYLGYYLKWHPQSCYYYSVEHGNFIPSPERTPGTYSKYVSIDDRIDDFHFYTTGIKFGIGRASYEAAQEIRSGDIEREEGVALVNRFDHEFPERFAEEVFKYLSLPSGDFPIASKMFETPIIDREYFTKLTDSFRSPHIWQKDGDEWRLRNTL